jgi:hypothetical protein
MGLCWSVVIRALLAVGLLPALGLAGAAIATGTAARRRFGVAVACGGWLVPWLVPAELPGLRAALVIVAIGGTTLIIGIARSDWPLARRIEHALSPVDSRSLRDVPRTIDARAFATFVAWLAPALGAAWFLARPMTGSPASWIARWAVGLVAIYSFAESMLSGFLPFVYRAIGKVVPTLHRAPGAARSVGELWGSRWNRPVSGWLERNIFVPLARVGRPRVGLALTFFASGTVHAYLVLVAAGATMALLMLAFFLTQAVLVAVERPLGVVRWPVAAKHGWTVVVLTLTSPLFTEPFLRSCGWAAQTIELQFP